MFVGLLRCLNASLEDEWHPTCSSLAKKVDLSSL